MRKSDVQNLQKNKHNLLTKHKKYVILVPIANDKNYEKELTRMINDEICKLRDKLNKSIEENEDYDTIYKLSIELDDLIAKYYNEKQVKQAK